jgi:hypothetical protein
MKLIRNNLQKSYATLFLAIIIGVLIWNNTVERNNIKELQKSLQALYEDRLMAEMYVFQLSGHLHKKLELIENPSQNEKSDSDKKLVLDQKIEQLNILYAATKLTDEEKAVFESFKVKINELHSLEIKIHLSAEPGKFSVAEINSFKSVVLTSLILLSDLSEIHILEGKKIIDEAKLLILGNSFMSEIEMSIIIIIAIIIQMLILSIKPMVSPIEQKSFLN